MRLCRPLIALLALVTVSSAFAGTLRVGPPKVQGENVSFPLILDGDVGAGVSQLNFRLNYDPNVLEPVSVETGPAAAAANKDVSSNLTADGRYNVIMFGLNRNTVSGGEVAQVLMRRKPGANAAQTSVGVADLALADPNATAIPSRPTTETLQLGANTGQTTPPTSDPNTTANPGQKPRTPATTTQPNAQPGATAKPGNTVVASKTPAAGTKPGATTPAGSKMLTTGVGTVIPGTAAGSQTGKTPAGATATSPSGQSGQPGTGPAAQQLAKAQQTAEQLRNGVAVPGMSIGAVPGTASGATETATTKPGTTASTTGSPTTVAALTPSTTTPGSVTSGTTPGTSVPASQAGDAAESTGGSLKWIFAVIAIALIAGIFAVRRKLFS